MRSWHEVPILPSDEPLIRVRGPRVISRSAYHEAAHPGAIPEVWMRSHAAELLVAASERLPEGLALVLWDGWRPVDLQARLYELYRAAIAAGHRELSDEQLDPETERFVSAPSSAATDPSPHLTGGAIDLTLGDLDGAPLEMGGPFDELGPRSAADRYERDDLDEGEVIYRDRRRLLCQVMTYVGFSNYPEEWWHFDIGNQFHHFRVGGPARYGPVTERLES